MRGLKKLHFIEILLFKMLLICQYGTSMFKPILLFLSILSPIQVLRCGQGESYLWADMFDALKIGIQGSSTQLRSMRNVPILNAFLMKNYPQCVSKNDDRY